jgi:pyridoxal phosphate enzyme (YggS family)
MPVSRELKARYEDVCTRVEKAAEKAGKRFGDITIVAVTKKVAIPMVREAVDLGISDFGENYFQEGREKVLSLGHAVQWHFIGHLQKNKAKQVAELFDMIQGVDSVELAEKLDHPGGHGGEPRDILLQVHYGQEGTKHGFLPAELVPAMEEIRRLQWIRVKGLMTIPPFYDNPELNRVNFADMRHCFNLLSEKAYPNWEGKYLSMGMTDDFELAIEEGSTMVRLGRVLFGERR